MYSGQLVFAPLMELAGTFYLKHRCSLSEAPIPV